MNIDPDLQQFCLLAGLAFAGVFVIALAAQVLKVYRARSWPTTTGKITESKVRTRKRQSDDAGQEYQSEPLVKYEYQVNGTPYRGTRISFAERIGGADVLPTLAHYPVGKQVQVYYDPANPQQAVLERDLPTIMVVVVGAIIIFFLGAAILLPFAFTGAGTWLAPWLPHPERAFAVTMLGAMGLFALLMAYAMQKQVWAANDWSKTQGKILVADVESYQKWQSSAGGSSRYTTMFRPSIVYTFDVNGQQFISDHVSFGGTMSSSIAGRAPSFVSEAAAKYAVGSRVDVYYDAHNPTDSVLERRASGVLFVLGFAVALWGLAAFFAFA